MSDDGLVMQIRKAIGRSGLSSAYIANEAHLCLATVYRLENGQSQYPRVTTLEAVCEVIGKRIELVDGARSKLADRPVHELRTEVWLHQQ